MKKKINLLLVEDDLSLRDFICDELNLAGYEVLTAANLEEGKRLLMDRLPDIVVTDLKLPDGRGDTLLEVACGLPLPPPVVLITAFGQVDDAVDALRKGAADFLTKPLDVEHLLLRLERIREVQELRKQARKLRQEQEHGGGNPAQLGTSRTWQQIEKQLPKLARTDDPVLITGPSGSGKEVVARRIHELSTRRDQPFIPVNCSGLSENLLESELFGHQAGAFTGANKARKGLFAAAEGGTILLDEIGDMPLEMQTKLLRTLQEKTVRPLGADHEQAIDVRVLAATNCDLTQLMEEGRFREDLFYRLETFHLELPPLRERREDIELFTRHFLEEAAEELKVAGADISEEAMAVLRGYAFPGNVRELKNIIRRAVAFADGGEIRPQDLPEKLRPQTVQAGPWSHLSGKLVPLDAIRRDYARHVLEACNDNKREAARVLGISRHTLYSLLDTK